MVKLAVVLMLMMVPVTTLAEEKIEMSEYEREALRLKYSFWSTNIVQGPDSDKVAGLGLFGSDVEWLSQREDEIGEAFRSYRSKKTTSGVLYLCAIAAFTGAAVLAVNNDGGDADAGGTGLLFGSLGLLIGGGAYDMSARESLSQSIWMYNGTLATEGPVPSLSSGEDDEEVSQENDLR